MKLEMCHCGTHGVFVEGAKIAPFTSKQQGRKALEVAQEQGVQIGEEEKLSLLAELEALTDLPEEEVEESELASGAVFLAALAAMSGRGIRITLIRVPVPVGGDEEKYEPVN